MILFSIYKMQNYLKKIKEILRKHNSVTKQDLNSIFLFVMLSCVNINPVYLCLILATRSTNSVWG
jgi:hypothetical protein